MTQKQTSPALKSPEVGISEALFFFFFGGGVGYYYPYSIKYLKSLSMKLSLGGEDSPISHVDMGRCEGYGFQPV